MFTELRADEIDLTKLTELKEVFFEGIAKKINASDLEKLEIITCSGLGIEELNVTGCSSLKSLYCRRNNLKTLDVTGLDNLEDLTCDKAVELVGLGEKVHMKRN